MLDFRFLLDNPEMIKQNCRDRNVVSCVEEMDYLLALGYEWKRSQQDLEDIRRHQNDVAQATGRERDATLRAELVAKGKGLKEHAASAEQSAKKIELKLK